MTKSPFQYSVKILILLLAILGTVSACSSSDDASSSDNGGGDWSHNVLKLDFSAIQAVMRSSTRATGDSSDVAGSNDESDFHTIHAWVFDNSIPGANATPLDYIEIDDAIRYQDKDGHLSTQVKVPKTVKNCDLYILANAGSMADAGTFSDKSTRGQLESLAFGTGPTVSDLPQKGLPISRIIKNISVAEFKDGNGIVKIPLLRAVSKVDFFLTKSKGMSSPSITGITLDGNTIPNESYVFPLSANYSPSIPNPSSVNIVTAKGYDADPIAYPGISQDNPFTNIKEVNQPLKRKNTDDAQTYKDRLLDSASLVALSYLKESDKPLACTIYYKRSSASAIMHQHFVINGQLLRDHELLVYAYFNGDNLNTNLAVVPWTFGGTYNFSAKVETMLGRGSYKIDQDSIVAVAYDKDNPIKYANQLQLTVSSPEGQKWILQTDNPDFGFIKLIGNTPSGITDQLTGIGGNQVITFYFVPKRDIDLTDPNRNYKANLYLTIPGYNEVNSGKVPFNAGDKKLPGSETDIPYIEVSKSLYNKLPVVNQ